MGVRKLCVGSGVGRFGFVLGRIGCQFGCAMCWLGLEFALLSVGFVSVRNSLDWEGLQISVV